MNFNDYDHQQPPPLSVRDLPHAAGWSPLWLARLERTQVLVSVPSTTNWKIGQVNPVASHLLRMI